MRVSITLTLEVDAAGWELDYGIGGAAAIREDVKVLVRGAVADLNDSLTVIRSR